MIDLHASSFILSLKDDSLKRFIKPSVMGIINMSPDSFFNAFNTISDALFAAEQMVSAGATFIDIGGEATNPQVNLEKAAPSAQQEIDRVVPIIEAVKSRFDVLISVDTSQPEVMREAVRYGADMINDQRSLRVQNALVTVAALKVPVCLMHFFHPPRMPGSTEKTILLNTIKNDLIQSLENCLAQGINNHRLIVDVGFGQGHYGKNCDENYYLLAHLQEIIMLGYPVLVGWSRKSMIGDLLDGVPPDQRLFGSIAAATIAAMLGAAIIRVHDVKETVDAMRVVLETRNKDYANLLNQRSLCF